ncbi:hypothetical protein ACFXHA_45425 [Nocardia sp. NPDC059240]|uniref:hypothetical protein n=1 Tax=Nocardia sp. NPDC059240 TaxID=3346786 RepID=UPI0036B20038
MTASRPARSPRRRPTTTGCAPVPSTLWADGTRPHDATGYGPIPVLSRAVREFIPPHGVFTLAALSPQQSETAPETLRSMTAHLRRHLSASAMPAGRITSLADTPTPADLIIASLLPPLPDPCDPQLLARLTLDAAGQLNPGGILAVLTCHSHDHTGRLLDPTGPVVAAAQASDLLYLSHIVAAPVTGDTIATSASHEGEPTPAARHATAHVDVAVFTLPQTQPHDAAIEHRAA